MAKAKSGTRRKITSPADDPVTAYALKVQSGEYPAGPHVRDACARHLRDLAEGPARGLRWDVAAAKRVIGFFADVLVVDKTAADPDEGEGAEATKPFVLLPWQAFIIGSLFGWKKANGRRRFRMAYVETGKGSGKSPMAAGIGLYMMTADGESRAECYAAATKKDQAKVLFRDAVAMVDKSAALSQRLEMGDALEKHNIAYQRTGSFFRPISTEQQGKGQSGPRPHFAALDEIHEHPTNAMVEFMRAGTKGRRQALIFMITNSGHDRQSVCWDYHDYGAKVCAGQIEDDSFFAYIAALDYARTETYNVDVSVERMASTCNCSAKHTLIGLSKPGGFARAVIKTLGESGISPPAGSALDTRIGQSFLAAFAATATKLGLPPLIPSTVNKALTEERDGPRAIATRPELLTPHGEPEKSKRSLTGIPKKGASANTISQQTNLNQSANFKAGLAEFAEKSLTVSGSITAIAREMSEDSCVINAMQESVCSEIVKNLFGAHSNTCETRRLYKLQNGSLARDFPADDPFADESCWAKANPSLGATFTMDYLREQVQQARGMPSKQNIVLRLNFCRWTDAEDAWIGKEQWDACEADIEVEALYGRQGYGAFDLSGKRDLTAGAFVFPAEDGTFDAFVEFWKPADTLTDAEDIDRVPYRQWRDQGHLLTTPGKTVDYSFVASRAGEITADFEIVKAAYDRWRIDDLRRELDAEGVSLELVECGQGFKDMAAAVEALEQMILNGRLRVKRNPVLRWNAASAVLEEDAAGNRKFTKRKATGRIDGIVALAMAAKLAMAGAEQQPEYQILFV